MRFLLLSIAILFSFNSEAQYAQRYLNYDDFAAIPILHEGRIKPLDTFARSYLLNISGKEKVEGITAIHWLAETLFDQQNAYNRKIFNITSPQVVGLLELQKRAKHRYSFAEISLALHKNIELIEKLQNKPKKELTQEQQQLIELYIKNLWYFDISRSLSLLLPTFVVENEELAIELNIDANKPFTYMDMLQRRAKLVELAEPIIKKEAKNLTKTEKEIIALALTLQRLSKDELTTTFSIIPPQWQQDGDVWVTPWKSITSGQSSPSSAKYLNSWRELAKFYIASDFAKWEIKAAQVNMEAFYLSGSSYIDKQKQKLEVLYNNLQPFKTSLIFYIGTFLLFIIRGLFWKNTLYIASLSMLITGIAVHFVGLITRMVIMNRPPVTTLYESIIFVALICTIFACILELKRRDGMGLFIGAILGIFMQFLGLKYAVDGDTMGMLAAVLDTNFWLATHVTTMTIGYGCAVVASALAHLYLLQKVTNTTKNKLNSTLKNILGASLVALFFSVLGTILGGIWADQSWGRFWGWDPKENGAMLLCLWLIWLIHGRIAGAITPLTFAAGMVITNVVLALAWFGVNLLNVGLHSYGFTENIATNLALFSGAEIIFVIIILIIIKLKRNVKT